MSTKIPEVSSEPFSPWPDKPSADYVKERMCKLTAWVCANVTGYARSSDCFCGKGGFWRHGFNETFAEGYRNQGEAVQWIENACKHAARKAYKRNRK